MKTSIAPKALERITAQLSAGNAEYLRLNPGELPARQPVHTVYGGAHLFKFTTTQRIGELAVASLEANAPTAEIFAQALQIQSPELARTVYARVLAKLKREAVEDFRIDFEDGFGYRPDAEEDATAVFAATQVAHGIKQGTLPSFIGIRIKTLSEELKVRALRTLEIGRAHV